MEKLISRYPAALIVFMTPMHRCGEDDVLLNNYGVRRCAPLISYVDAIIEAAGSYGIPVLDLYRISGIQPNVPVLKEQYMPDGLHPNDHGHERIAQRLRGFLCTL